MAEQSSLSGLSATSASKACENSRPITAPICATSLAGPSRSSRAISEACRLAGTAIAGEGAIGDCLRRRSLAPRLQYRLGHFLYKQRDAVSSLDDVLSDVLGQARLSSYAFNHRVDVALAQAG